MRLGLARAGLLAGLLASAAATSTSAQSTGTDPLVLDAPRVWAYAEALLADGEYYRAVSEYQRLRYYFPESDLAAPAGVRIGEAHLLGGEPGVATDAFTGLLNESPPPTLADVTRYLRALARLELDDHRPYPLREAHVTAALDDLRHVRGDWAGAPNVQGFVAALEAPPELPSKSPWLAGGLSAVLPGAGSAYVGRWREAGLAFFATGVVGYAAASSFENDQVALGGVLGVLALAFYGGNVYAAANGAHKFNADAQAGYLAEQRTRFGIVPRQGGVSATVLQSF